MNDQGKLTADVRAELRAYSPYFHDDDEITGALSYAMTKWGGFRKRLAETLKLSERQRYEREPIPDIWIVQDAAERVYSRLPRVMIYIRATGLLVRPARRSSRGGEDA